jgi:hypothetical protein
MTMNWVRWAIIALLMMGSPAYARSRSNIAAIADKARAEAAKWQRDAQLVQIEVTHFGFAEGRSGMPDMTKAGAPGYAMFNFFSPSTRQALRINVFLKGSSAMQVERLTTPYSPYTLPIPEQFIDPDDAIAEAQRSGIDRECAGENPLFPTSCSLVSNAELHVYWSGAGQSGKPIWKISFGQHPSTYELVARQVDATSGKVVAVADLQAATVRGETDTTIAPSVVDLSNMERDFTAAWRVVNEAVAKQDPLYKPYAIGLVLSLNENQENLRAKVVLHHAYVQLARLTPSARWDDLQVHVEWSSNTRATMTIGAPSRRSSPWEPRPAVITPSRFWDADPSLRKLVNLFPRGYREVYTYTEIIHIRGKPSQERIVGETKIIDPPTEPKDVPIEVKNYIDFVYVGLTLQGNPHYRTEVPPLPSEYALINQTAPREKWVWWARIKQHDQWQYQIVDAATGALTAVCTSPPDATSPTPRPVDRCR